MRQPYLTKAQAQRKALVAKKNHLKKTYTAFLTVGRAFKKLRAAFVKIAASISRVILPIVKLNRTLNNATRTDKPKELRP